MGSAQAAHRRRVRERELVAATRALFDERGVQEAPIEEIARAVGIARGLIYRHFSSKEELFVLTVTDYLAELESRLDAAAAAGVCPRGRLERCTEAYAAFCLRYPAFLDSSLALMRRPARDLRQVVSESVWLRLGQGMARCIDHLVRILRSGSDSGAFAVDDPEYMANVLWTQTLGTMHMARIRVGVCQLSADVPRLYRIEPEAVVRTCVASALAVVAAEPR